MKVYIVHGMWGQGDDYEEWAVAAYLSERAAKEHAAQASKAANELKRLRPLSRKAWSNPYDHDFPVGKAGANVRYAVYALELLASSGEYLANRTKEFVARQKKGGAA